MVPPFPGNLAAVPAAKGAHEAKEARVDQCSCGADFLEVEPFESAAAPRRPSGPEVERAVRTLIAAAGDDPLREGLMGGMATRGVNQHGISMVMKCWLGDFKADPGLRRELMASLGCGSARMAS